MSAVEALDTMDARIPWQDPETGHGEPLCGVWRVVRKHRNIIMRGFRIRTCSQGGWPLGSSALDAAGFEGADWPSEAAEDAD